MPGWDIFFQTILSLFVENTSPTVFFCLDFCRVVFLDVSGDSQIPTSFFWSRSCTEFVRVSGWSPPTEFGSLSKGLASRSIARRRHIGTSWSHIVNRFLFWWLVLRLRGWRECEVQWSVGTHGKQNEYYWDCFGTCKLSSTFYYKPKSPSQRVSDKAMFTSRLLHPFWPLVCSCINSSVHPMWICPEDRVCRRADASADIFRRFVDLGSGRGMAVGSSGSLCCIGSQGTLNLLIMWKYPTLSISYLSKRNEYQKIAHQWEYQKLTNISLFLLLMGKILHRLDMF